MSAGQEQQHIELKEFRREGGEEGEEFRFREGGGGGQELRGRREGVEREGEPKIAGLGCTRRTCRTRRQYITEPSQPWFLAHTSVFHPHLRPLLLPPSLPTLMSWNFIAEMP